MNFQIMDTISQSNERANTSPFFRRTNHQIRCGSILTECYRYELINIAKINTKLCDLYLNYFQSQWKKKITSSQRSISEFFEKFVEIFALKILIGKYGKIISGTILSIIQDFVDIKKDTPDDKQLKKYLKNQITVYYDQRYLHLSEKKYATYLQKATVVERQIKQVLKQFKQNLQNNQFLQNIKSTQFIPNMLDDKHLKRWIINNFQCLCNINIFRPYEKRKAWQRFYQINQPYLPHLQIVFLSQQLDKNQNKFIMPKHSNASHPFLISMKHLLRIFNRPNKGIRDQINKQIMKIMSTYHEQTNNFYPNLSIDDIYLDQRNIRPSISYRQLLFDALGFQGQTKNFQQRLTFNPCTPSIPNYHQSHLEHLTKQFLKKSYYYPQNSNQSSKEIEKISQQEIQLRKVKEKIHVWRLITIFYFIITGRHYMDYCFKLQKRPFYMQHYYKVLRQQFEKIQRNQISLQTIIPMNGQNVNKQEIFQHGLSFRRLKNHLRIEDNKDELLQRLKYMKDRQNLFLRKTLCKTILDLLQEQFKKLPNSIIYLIKYCLIVVHMAENKRFLAKIQREYEQSSQLFSKQYCCKFNNVSLENQQKKASKEIKSTLDKFNQYKQKNKLKNVNIDLVNHIQSLISLIDQKQLKKVGASKKQKEFLRQQIEDNTKEIYDFLNSKVKPFIQQQLNIYLNRLKKCNNSSIYKSTYWNLKLKILFKSYFLIRQNYRGFQNLLKQQQENLIWSYTQAQFEKQISKLQIILNLIKEMPQKQ